MEGLIVADDDYYIVVDFGFTLQRYLKDEVYEIDDKYWLVV